MNSEAMSEYLRAWLEIYSTVSKHDLNREPHSLPCPTAAGDRPTWWWLVREEKIAILGSAHMTVTLKVVEN